MAEIGSAVYLDNWNYFKLYAEEVQVDSANNRSLVNYGLNLHVAGHVESSGIQVGVTDKNADLGYQYYGAGTHTLISNQKWVTHNEDGSKTITLDWYWNAYIGNRIGSASLTLTKIQRAAGITSFTGTDVDEAFSATFDTVSGATEYKLRISIPYVVMLQKFDNYTSGKEVYLSSQAIKELRSRATGNTIDIGGIIETYKNGTFVGESSPYMITIGVTGSIKIAINGEYKDAVMYVGVNNEWKEATPYIGVNNEWKEGI